jgi:F0F1-type ATP synthase assembly protein I
MAERPRHEGEPTIWAELGRHAHHGFQLAIATGLFLGVGWWLDGKAGTAPVLTILGALIGASAGFYSMIHSLKTKPGSSSGSEMEEREGKG